MIAPVLHRAARRRSTPPRSTRRPKSSRRLPLRPENEPAAGFARQRDGAVFQDEAVTCSSLSANLLNMFLPLTSFEESRANTLSPAPTPQSIVVAPTRTRFCMVDHTRGPPAAGVIPYSWSCHGCNRLRPSLCDMNCGTLIADSEI